MALSFNALRVGKKYYLVNHGERFEFEVLSRFSQDDFLVKDLNTLELYRLKDLVKYGRGTDFDLDAIGKA
jgi:hypothetical protein